jgi:hypothetical protein
MSQMDFLSALQFGGVSATAMGIMFGIYKILTLIVNHRCRSDCCGRWFSLGIAVEETTPPTHRFSIGGEATLNHRLLPAGSIAEKHSRNLHGFSSAPPELWVPQNRLEEGNRSPHSSVAEDSSSLV